MRHIFSHESKSTSYLHWFSCKFFSPWILAKRKGSFFRAWTRSSSSSFLLNILSASCLIFSSFLVCSMAGPKNLWFPSLFDNSNTVGSLCTGTVIFCLVPNPDGALNTSSRTNLFISSFRKLFSFSRSFSLSFKLVPRKMVIFENTTVSDHRSDGEGHVEECLSEGLLAVFWMPGLDSALSLSWPQMSGQSHREGSA